MQATSHLGFWDYVQRHWTSYSGLALAAVAAVALGAWPPWGLSADLFYGFAGGVASLLLFQVTADYKNLELLAETLDRQQLSFHVGARLHESHEGVIARGEAIRRFLPKRGVLRLLTSTADDYLLPSGDGHAALREKLSDGIRLQLLLFTPVFNLRSFLDTRDPITADGAHRADHASHGQRHRHASVLIAEQLNNIIPAIELLQREFPGQIEARFFNIKHHVNMAIYDNKRLFAAPLLSGTQGRDLPCIEMFPGYLSTGLFDKFVGEFNYIWNKRALWFALPEIKMVYQHLADAAPEYLMRHWIDGAKATEIEDLALRTIPRTTNEKALPVPSSDSAIVARRDEVLERT